MADVSIRRSSPFWASAGWFAHECIQRDFSAPQARLSNNSYIEAFLQGLLLFGPPAFLLIGTPLRIFHLYRAKLVTVPNYRGLVKLVSEKGKFGPHHSVTNWSQDCIIHCLRLAAGLHYYGDRWYGRRHASGVSSALLGCICCVLCAVLLRAWPVYCAIHHIDSLPCLLDLRRCYSRRPPICGNEPRQPFPTGLRHLRS